MPLGGTQPTLTSASNQNDAPRVAAITTPPMELEAWVGEGMIEAVLIDAVARLSSVAMPEETTVEDEVVLPPALALDGDATAKQEPTGPAGF